MSFVRQSGSISDAIAKIKSGRHKSRPETSRVNSDGLDAPTRIRSEVLIESSALPQ